MGKFNFGTWESALAIGLSAVSTGLKPLNEGLKT